MRIFRVARKMRGETLIKERGETRSCILLLLLLLHEFHRRIEHQMERQSSSKHSSH